MEAVKKLQASSKLLQKVTYAWRLCLELAPPTRRLASAWPDVWGQRAVGGGGGTVRPLVPLSPPVN